MKKQSVAALALIAGLAAGALVGLFDEDDRQIGPYHAASDCPRSGAVTKFTTRLSVNEGSAQQAEVRGSAEAEVAQADGSWTPDRLPGCVFSNDETQVLPNDPEYERLGPPQLAVAQYDHDRDASKLGVKYAETLIPLRTPAGAPAAGPPNPGSYITSFTSPALVAYRQGRVLHLDIDICRSPRVRLVCQPQLGKSEPTKTQPVKVEPVVIELVIADTIRAENSIVNSTPQPVSLKPDTAAHTTTYTWRLPDPTTPLSVEIPLAWTVRWTAQSSSIGDRGNLSIGTARFRINWPALWDTLPTLLALALATFFLGRFGKRTAGIGLTLAFAALLAGLAIDVRPYQPGEDLFSACTWAAATILSAVRWRGPLIGAALIGLFLAVSGAVWGSQTALSIGLLVTVTAGLVSLGARLLVIPRLLSIAALDNTSPWFKVRALSVRGGLAKTALFVLIATAAVSAGDTIGRYSSDGRSLAQLVESVVSTSSSNIGWVVLSATAVLVLCIGLTQFTAIKKPQLQITSAQVVALTLVVAIVVPPPTVRWAGFGLPVWLLTWLTLALVVRGRQSAELAEDGLSPQERLALALDAEKSRGEMVALDSKLTAGTASLTDLETSASAHRRFYPGDPAADLFRRGSGKGWFANAGTAAWIGTALALVLVGYYVFGALRTLPDRLPYNGLLYLTMRVLAEFARWVGLAFAFGALYQRLPTRVGASKGAVLGLAWMAGAGLAELAAGWRGTPTSGLWLYLSLQVVVFLIVLGAVYDFMIIESSGGTWRRLTDLYRIQTVRQRVAYLGPLVLALIGLADQIRVGAPGELAKQVLAGVGAFIG